jgi:hypothetical protein
MQPPLMPEPMVTLLAQSAGETVVEGYRRLV